MANRYWLTSVAPSTFGHLVSNVIKISPKKKVLRVYAERIIALMKNVHALWDNSVMQLITKTVYRYTFIINTYLPVAIRLTTPSLTKPVPAVISLFNLSPKSVLRSVVEGMTVPFKGSVVSGAITNTSGLLTAVHYLANSVRGVWHSSFPWLSGFVASQRSPIMHFAHTFRVDFSIAAGYNTSHASNYTGVY